MFRASSILPTEESWTIRVWKFRKLFYVQLATIKIHLWWCYYNNPFKFRLVDKTGSFVRGYVSRDLSEQRRKMVRADSANCISLQMGNCTLWDLCNEMRTFNREHKAKLAVGTLLAEMWAWISYATLKWSLEPNYKLENVYSCSARGAPWSVNN